METYRFSVWVPRHLSLAKVGVEREIAREEFYDWLWASFGTQGLSGVHEGTVLSEEAAEQGLETDSWHLDSAQAPQSRDWIGQQEEAEAELYFTTEQEAAHAVKVLAQIPALRIGPIVLTPDEDWNAQWKASFLNAEEGIAIPPFWRIFPPWKTAEQVQLLGGEKFLRVNPGAGFGTGTHETTQLCLQAIGEWSRSSSAVGAMALDFGSGSGILAVGLGLLGAQIDAVEVDPLAIDNARENAEINGVTPRISYSLELPQRTEKYDVIVANILKPILLEFAEVLTAKLKANGTLILSGLIEKDVPVVEDTYSSLLPAMQAQVLQKGEWFAIVFSAASR